MKLLNPPLYIHKPLDNIIVTQISLYRSKKKLKWVLLICTVLFLIEVWILFDHASSCENRFYAWAGLLFWAIGIIFASFRLLNKEPQIIINNTGIFDKSVHDDFILWHSIEGIVENDFNSKKLTLRMDNEFRPSKKVKQNKSLDFNTIDISLKEIKVEQKKIEKLILDLTIANRTEREKIIKKGCF